MAGHDFAAWLRQEDRKKVAWLLRFAGLDLEHQPPGALVDLFRQSQWIHTLGPGGMGHRDPGEWEEYFTGSRTAIAELRHHQAELRKGLEAIDAGKAWELPLRPGATDSAHEGHPIRWRLWRSKDTGLIMKVFVAEPTAAFFLSVADLFVAFGSGIRRCQNPACRAFFLMDDPRQQYCSKSCSERVRQARYRPKRPKPQRDYHAEHKRRVEKKHPGAKVKVGRRG